MAGSLGCGERKASENRRGDSLAIRQIFRKVGNTRFMGYFTQAQHFMANVPKHVLKSDVGPGEIHRQPDPSTVWPNCV
jgi:hypothetical protein